MKAALRGGFSLLVTIAVLTIGNIVRKAAGLPEKQLAAYFNLSRELHSHILETYARVATGDKTLAVEIIEKQKKPEDAEWIANRANAVVARSKFTKCLQEHGVTKGYEIAGCTNAVYQGMFEKTAKEIKEERNLPANANLRDSMDETELLSIALAENLAKRKIQTTNSQGYTECKTRCLDASKIIADAVKNAL